MKLEIGARTDVGRVRKNNEDSFQVEPALQLCILSDGMGGQALGEVASQLAVETIVNHCRLAAEGKAPSSLDDPRADLSTRTNQLVTAARAANRAIFESACSHPEQRGMGATLVAGWLDGEKLSLVHVGDSRAYLLRKNVLQQLTADHSLVAEKVRMGIMTEQEANESELQSVLTRAIGVGETVVVDADEHPLFDGDMLLFCSDGLSRMVGDAEIAHTLGDSADAQTAANRLVELALEAGGLDNVTVVVVRAKAGGRGFWGWLFGRK